MKLRSLFLLFTLVMLTWQIAVCETGKNVTFLPQWLPQAQFAGYYAAVDKGIYSKYGLDVKILQGGPNLPSLEGLANGKADFASAIMATAIEKRAQGIKLVNIAQIVQRSALIIVAKKQSGIKTIQDLNGKKISIWKEFDVQPKALIKKLNLNVVERPQGFTLNLFLRDGVDAASAMWYNEYHTILNCGYDENELTTFFYDEFDLNIPEDGIYTMEKTLGRESGFMPDFRESLH